MERFYFCIDVGGTFVKYACMDPQGRILTQGKCPTPHRDQEEFTSFLADLVPGDTSGIAVCFPGFIDSEKGICRSCGTLEWLGGEYPLARQLSARTGLPVTVENDARCACLAEAWRGALKGISNGAVMVLGTAVGTGLILDGKPYYGALGKAGELGYNRTGKRGYWGYACSVPFLCEDAAAALGLPGMTGEELMDRYACQDPLITGLVEEYLATLSDGIFSMQNLLDLQRIAIGGGISQNAGFLTALRHSLHRIYEEIPYQLHEPELTACIYSSDANLIGALYFYLTKEGEKDVLRS